jgi:hypothetical protein
MCCNSQPINKEKKPEEIPAFSAPQVGLEPILQIA